MKREKLQLAAWLMALLVWAGCAWASPTWAGVQAELTFDDGPDLSGNADGRSLIDNLSGLGWRFEFVGGAMRSAIVDGRYGRAALFPGQGHIDIEFPADLPPLPDFLFFLWVRSDTSAASIFQATGSLEIKLVANEVVLEYVNQAGAIVTHTTGKMIPSDSAFHHLTVEFTGQSLVTGVDFSGLPDELVGVSALNAFTTGTMGLGLTGMLDELLLARIAKTKKSTTGFKVWERIDYLIDRNPAECGDPLLSCREDVIFQQPTNWPEQVPTRFKTIWNPLLCNAANPCPLLFYISGGGYCNDDYIPQHKAQAYANEGLIVTSIDPYCEYGFPFQPNPHESSQFPPVKDFIMNDAQISAWLSAEDSGDYAVAGCSHGAKASMMWGLVEADHPARFATISGNYAGHCTYHRDPSLECDSAKTVRDILYAGLACSPHGPGSCIAESDPQVFEINRQWGPIYLVQPSFTQDREIMALWGANTSGGPNCDGAGNFLCPEEGEGVSEGSRRMRDLWQAWEDPANPSGYFWEHTVEDCIHCPWDTQVAQCSACFLKYGRSRMPLECPSCLSVSQGRAVGGMCWVDCSNQTCQLIGQQPGRKLKIRNKLPDDIAKNRILFDSKDPSMVTPAPGSIADPRCSTASSGGRIRVSSTTSGQSFWQDLPCQNWSLIGSEANPHGYRYKDTKLADGPCKRVLLRTGSRLKVSCMGGGPFALDYDLQLGQSQTSVTVTVETGQLGLPGAQGYCAKFGGVVKKDGSDGKSFLAKNAAAPASCP